jgi:glycerol kinase
MASASSTPGCVLAIDQGTSATKAILLDPTGTVRAQASVPVGIRHPRPGHAEQDAEDIWASVQQAVQACLRDVDAGCVAAVGLSTQRESTLLWDRDSGRPVGPMLGWQDGRGARLCARVRERGDAERVRATSGLPVDAMFSASKAAWLLDTYDADRDRSRSGRLCLGTVDSWLLWKLSGEHVIEVGNASRTQLLDIASRSWDPWLCDVFGVPQEALPRVVPSIPPSVTAQDLAPLSADVPVTAVLGDSHAALFAHAGWRPGNVKATYGTGSSVMGLTESVHVGSAGLARTIAWEIDKARYALEGNIRSSGATLVWLANLFGTDPGSLARSAAPSSDGVVLVPAFTGLGAPWWDDGARAVLVGMTEGTRVGHLARAALETIASQVEDVVAEVEREVGRVGTVLADGGATDNEVLMQLQADISGREVHRASARDLSAIGAAHMAGLGAGLWTTADLESMARERTSYVPAWDDSTRTHRMTEWHAAVALARTRSSADRTSAMEHP